jgi:membrane protease YdiL (CAAX protease family)
MPSELSPRGDVEITAMPLCINCNEPLTTGNHFCRHCGSAQVTQNADEITDRWNAVRQLLLFFLIDAVICCLVSFIPVFHALSWSIAVDILFASVSVIFFVLNWSRFRSLLVWNNFSFARLAGYCAIAVVSSVVVGIFIDWLNHSLFSKHFSYYTFYQPHKYGKELAIFFIAVMPALFEELGYRGFLLGKLMLVTERKQAIFISAFMFAIMHRSFLSLCWLIPFGLWQANIRVKQNTIWYGVCTHFCFNFTVVATEIWQVGHHH